jgi:hypothetical protein
MDKQISTHNAKLNNDCPGSWGRRDSDLSIAGRKGNPD